MTTASSLTKDKDVLLHRQQNAAASNDSNFTPNSSWKVKAKPFLVNTLGALRGAASGFFATFFVSSVIAHVISPTLLSLAPGILFAIPFSYAVLMALPLGIVIGISAYALYFDGLENRFNFLFPDKISKKPINNLPKDLTTSEKTRNKFVYGISILASVLEFVSVSYSTYTTTAAVLALTTFIPSPIAIVSGILLASVLGIGAFLASYHVTAPAIRKKFSVKSLYDLYEDTLNAKSSSSKAEQKFKDAYEARKAKLSENSPQLIELFLTISDKGSDTNTTDMVPPSRPRSRSAPH